MLKVTPVISCLTTFNLPWFMDLTFLGSYAILLFIASDPASTTSHIHNWVLFFLWLHPFILSGVISPLITSSIFGTYRPGEFIFQCPIFLPFHTVQWGPQSKNTEVVCYPLLQLTTFCQTSPLWPVHLGLYTYFVLIIHSGGLIICCWLKTL